MMYAELQCKTNFSFLMGASHADELVARAVALGYRALAITDVDSLSGIVRAWTAARDTALPLIYGAEVRPFDAPPIVLWVPRLEAYKKLSRLLTVGRRRAEKGNCRLGLDDIAQHSEGLLAGLVPQPPANCQDGAAEPRQAMHHDALKHYLGTFRDIFGDRGYLLASLHRQAEDGSVLTALQRLAADCQVPLVASGDVHYHVPERMLLYDVLVAIRNGTTVAAAGDHRFSNAERHLRQPTTIARLFAAAPEAVARTVEIADRCQFRLEELRYQYPRELAPAGMTAFEHLRQLTWEGAAHRYPAGIADKVRELLQYELDLIRELHYEAYFLTVWDLVRFARSRDILCQGRGSAANSAVCYCLGVTSVDPARMDVLFERFVSRERNEAPDIDIDFEHERREEVLQYLYDKYGRERAGMTAVVNTYRVRSAIRDAGKALGLSLDRVDALAKQVEGYVHEEKLPERCAQVGIDPESSHGQRLISVVNELIGFPRHLSQHVGGMVMTEGPLCELVPIENAAMEGRTVIGWDKNDLDDLGILKVDCLGLGMLSAIRRCFALVKQHTGRALTLANIPAEDPTVYDMICEADTIGLFQIESRAQMSMLPRLRPRCYYDLVIEVAIVRPGPIQGQMVHPYLRRRAGDEPVEYATPEIRQVLEKTLGVPIFQEQAMRLAVVAAGFTPGEADQLRRAMGKWRKTGVMEKFREQLINGMRERGLPESFAQQVFQQIRGFGEYGFPESHAASFALLVYVSAYLKRYYPAAYAAAIINSQPMGFYAPAQLIRDARDHQVEIRSIDVNASEWDCTLEPRESASETSLALRLGMRLIVGLSPRSAAAICEARGRRAFTSQEDVARRARLGRNVMTQLAQADAFGSLGRDRRQALWEALSQETQPRDMPLFNMLPADDEPPVQLPELGELEQVFADYDATGLSLREHPISFFRAPLRARHAVTAAQLAELPNDRSVCVAGIVLLRQRPSTAKGITFVTLEDETGTINLVLHQKTWERYYTTVRRSPAWVAYGRVESKYSVIHVVVHRVVDFGKFVEAPTASLSHKSRDFR